MAHVAWWVVAGVGAFFAGLVVLESESGRQAMAEVLPFRDSFDSLFFRLHWNCLMDWRVLLPVFAEVVTGFWRPSFVVRVSCGNRRGPVRGGAPESRRHDGNRAGAESGSLVLFWLRWGGEPAALRVSPVKSSWRSRCAPWLSRRF